MRWTSRSLSQPHSREPTPLPLPDVLNIFLHTSSVAPSQWDLSSEATPGRIASALLHPSHSLHPAGCSRDPGSNGSENAVKGRVRVRTRGRWWPRGVRGQPQVFGSARTASCTAYGRSRWRFSGRGRSHHRGESGHRSHLVVLGPGLQILQREERRVVQAERVRGQRRPQWPGQRVLLQVQQQAARAVPLRLALLRRLAPERAESRGQRTARPFPATRPARAPRLTATWCADSGTRS